MEDTEIEGETELDGVAGREVDGVGLVVGSKGGLLHFVKVVTLGVLSDVAVVVTHHLDEEGLGLAVAGLREHLVVDHVNNFLTVSL